MRAQLLHALHFAARNQETDMKQSQIIAANNRKAYAAAEAAEKCAIAKDQVWSLGMTKFTFDDNSVLAVRDVDVFAIDADDAASIRKYGEWIGSDSADETAEVERLLAAIKE
jgi:hypothetical protein